VVLGRDLSLLGNDAAAPVETERLGFGSQNIVLLIRPNHLAPQALIRPLAVDHRYPGLG